MTIVFYISGHGFGHASREIEVINALAARRRDARIVVRSTVGKWFFDAALRARVEQQPLETDTGIAQIDSLRLDEDETGRRAARFYADFDRRVDEEAAVLRDLHASAVVGDIPPLAFAAAEGACVPSVAIGNFTWDWIYGGYPQFERLAPGVIDMIRRAYARAARALRLPLHGGFESMTRVPKDIPFIARRSLRGREDARRALGLERDGTVVLASFGGYGLDLRYADIARTSRFTLVVTDHDSSTGSGAGRASSRDEARNEEHVERDDRSGGRLRQFTSRELADCGVRYEDLVAASDVVVSKPGYGIVSECIANGAALLYTSRGRFREHEVLVAGMPQVLRCRYISQEDLLAGRWAPGVRALLGQLPPPKHLETNGAEVAAGAIAEVAETSQRVRP